MDWVRIIGLELDCIVGIFAYERDREQRVRLDLAMNVDARRAGRSGRIAQTVDYDLVAQHLVRMLHFRRYQLIEMAAEELTAMLLLTQPELKQVRLSIEKPGALEGRAQSAQVEVTRTIADFEQILRETAVGRQRQLLRTRDACLSAMTLDPGSSWKPEHDGTTRCIAWVLDGEVKRGGKKAAPGVPHECTSDQHPVWTNETDHPATLFRCMTC